MCFKIKTVLLLFFILFFSLSAICKEQKTEKIPKAVINNPVFEFPPVVDGTIITHDFIIYNKGSATLEIIKIKPG